jgi:hypothetical protein
LAIASIVGLLLTNVERDHKEMTFEQYKTQYGLKFDSMFEESYRERPQGNDLRAVQG